MPWPGSSTPAREKASARSAPPNCSCPSPSTSLSIIINLSHSDLETAVTAGEDKGVTAEFVEDRLEHMVNRIEEGEADLFVAFTQMGDVYRVDRASDMH